jgi:hypothetical protein
VDQGKQFGLIEWLRQVTNEAVWKRCFKRDALHAWVVRRPPSSLHGGDQFGNSQKGDDTLDVIGEDMEAHFCSDVFLAFASGSESVPSNP